MKDSDRAQSVVDCMHSLVAAIENAGGSPSGVLEKCRTYTVDQFIAEFAHNGIRFHYVREFGFGVRSIEVPVEEGTLWPHTMERKDEYPLKTKDVLVPGVNTVGGEIKKEDIDLTKSPPLYCVVADRIAKPNHRLYLAKIDTLVVWSDNRLKATTWSSEKDALKQADLVSHPSHVKPPAGYGPHHVTEWTKDGPVVPLDLGTNEEEDDAPAECWIIASLNYPSATVTERYWEGNGWTTNKDDAERFWDKAEAVKYAQDNKLSRASSNHRKPTAVKLEG